MELKNVTRYTPDDPDYDNNFLYFRSEDGQDFYESLSKFTKKYKLCIDSENIIRSVSEDVSRLYPAGFSVVEVNKLPAGFNIYGDWKYSNGAVVAVPVDYHAKAETTRQKLLTDANSTIVDWRTELAAKWHLNRSQFGIRIDHDLASISDHSLASQSITIWHASDH